MAAVQRQPAPDFLADICQELQKKPWKEFPEGSGISRKYINVKDDTDQACELARRIFSSKTERFIPSISFERHSVNVNANINKTSKFQENLKQLPRIFKTCIENLLADWEAKGDEAYRTFSKQDPAGNQLPVFEILKQIVNGPKPKRSPGKPKIAIEVIKGSDPFQAPYHKILDGTLTIQTAQWTFNRMLNILRDFLPPLQELIDAEVQLEQVGSESS